MIVEKPYKDDDEVCMCMGLTAGHIRELVENGATSIEEILEMTGAGSICGECTGIAVAVAREYLRAADGGN